ncbi:ATP-binding cassette domain-containing protein [Brevibacterium sp. JNUCC-42]|nr:ATP-binding cassette domain-containing protein [Brevibacterium sp. JNUCC-42]
MSQQPLIELHSVSFQFPNQPPLLTDISLHINQGERIAIVGHNGCGKSTLVKLLNGLHRHTQGEICVAGQMLSDESLPTIRKQIGMVFQNPENQFVGTTVADDILFGLENLCLGRSVMHDRLIHYAEKLEISHFLHKHPDELSGGQKQRVAIASILAMQPSIIIFDEATSMLDETAKNEIGKLIGELHQEGSYTSLSITHDAEEILAADRVIALSRGKLLADTTPHELFSHPEWLTACHLNLPFTWAVSQMIHDLHPDIPVHSDEQDLMEDLWRFTFMK